MHSFKHSIGKYFRHTHNDDQQHLEIHQNITSSPKPPTKLDIIRYRYHYGVNLGSVYVLENWLFGSAFPPSATDRQTSELEAVKGWTNEIGLEATREKFESRWRDELKNIDWDWLANKARVTSIRLPIGYFTLGPDYCNGTPFEPYATVYRNAWNSVRALVATARFHGIGVLIDYHALPGGANPGDHSGTNSGAAELWNNVPNLVLAQRCLEFLAKEISGGSVVDAIGLEIINEAEWGAPGMYEWYDKMIAAISAIDCSIPLYISDAWDLTRAISYVRTRNKATVERSQASCPVAIDTHLYFCFVNDDKSPQQIIASIPEQLNQLNGQDGSVVDRGAVQVVIGEWACVMSDTSWKRMGASVGPTTKDQQTLRTQFGNAQCQRWCERSGGSYFWTLRMDWMNGGDWGFVEQTNNGTTCAPSNLLLSAKDVKTAVEKCAKQQTQIRDQSFAQHVNYWNEAAPNKTFDHDLFRQGYYLGWNDALIFFEARSKGLLGGDGVGADKIGMLDLWVRKRILDCGVTGEFVWEFEVGYRKAVADFYALAGV
ncbi:glycoside hydrolase family protein [Venturia nashicola]|nr:glycoside hydrolase family protein [Venturia nashicola]